MEDTRVWWIAEIGLFFGRIAEKVQKYRANIGNNIQGGWRIKA